MVSIVIKNVSKRYQDIWIIKNMNLDVASGACIGISGINGSGKSTLLKMISGYLSPSKGEIKYQLNNKSIAREEWYQHLSLAGPYTDVIQEFTLEELYHFHRKFKPIKRNLSFDEFYSLLNLDIKEEKTLQKYSSGMKQKVQLALALLTDVSVLLLDEPTSYLDVQNKDWFYDLLKKEKGNRTVIIASNEVSDFQLCDSVIDL